MDAVAESAMGWSLLFTCEHGGNRVPRRYATLFVGADSVLASHRGYDPGTLVLGRRFATAFRSPLIAATVSRLVVELNRSPHHPRLFSEFTQGLDSADRHRLLNDYYWPHRQAIETHIAAAIARGESVLHVGVHSFTPTLNGCARRADVGWLYDPRRDAERQLSGRWLDGLKRLRPDLLLRRNYPYLGKADGLTTHLRRQFSDQQYAGVELEVNQRWPQGSRNAWQRLQRDLIASLHDCLGMMKAAHPRERTARPSLAARARAAP